MKILAIETSCDDTGVAILEVPNPKAQSPNFVVLANVVASQIELGKKYGAERERRTEIASFERVDRMQVVAATETLYLDAKNGFAGYGLKKEEPVEKCSTIDDIITFTQDGKMRVLKVADKVFVGQRPLPGVSDRRRSLGVGLERRGAAR